MPDPKDKDRYKPPGVDEAGNYIPPYPPIMDPSPYPDPAQTPYPEPTPSPYEGQAPVSPAWYQNLPRISLGGSQDAASQLIQILRYKLGYYDKKQNIAPPTAAPAPTPAPSVTPTPTTAPSAETAPITPPREYMLPEAMKKALAGYEPSIGEGKIMYGSHADYQKLLEASMTDASVATYLTPPEPEPAPEFDYGYVGGGGYSYIPSEPEKKKEEYVGGARPNWRLWNTMIVQTTWNV